MRVLSVQLRDFRTYARADARLGDGLTVVHGPNGAGKSNLLEALYYGCTARSPRTRNERELVRFGAQAARVSLRLRDESDEHELSVGFGTVGDGAQPVKRMTADGAPVERLLDVECRPLVSVFLPDRLELVKGPPALRRAHLDQVVAAIWPARAEVRREYSRVLAQRNALLASHPLGPGVRRDARHVGPRARRQGARASRRPRRGGRAAGGAVLRARGAAGLRRRGRARVQATLARRERGGVHRRAARAPARATSSAASPATAPTATSSR